MARIVVVSDEPETRAQLLQSLDREHDIVACGRPDRARAVALRDSAPDLVIIELGALFDPVDVLGPAHRLEKQRSCESTVTLRTRAPAVLVLVPPGGEDRIIDCFEAGADDYLLAPVDAAALKAKVERALVQRLGLWGLDPGVEVSISDDGRILGCDEVEGTDELQANLGRYEVRGILGKGGYGVVYRAWDLALEREVALKVLPREMHENAEAVARFFRESTAIGRLNHPNIVKFYEVGSFQGRFYFTMELVPGRTLKDIADKEAPLPTKKAARYVAGIARALAALDSLGLVHRDVKPENVIVTEDGGVKLIDFGLVKIRDTAAITSQDDVLGTPYFMAPEYIRAPGVPDIRYDLYALGITFFHLLTGEYPFDGKNAAHVMEKHLRQPPPKVGHYQPGVPLIAEKIIERLLQKDPAKRPQTPDDVLVMIRPLIR
jgi:DNA-binding response OmpR family regulator/predicted Ser/Thr protein kinase